ncbi:LysR family transcriptional regulator [Inquilinus limosus]|uniref:LysR family transcriptional regulator n=1 Tax=Inquilinus limosus TaxID=171674 RepID=UPI0011982040|nr:LysR family transcriptional regulator [Inquilinus limosus]
MRDLNLIRLFARVAEHHSITSAARVLGMPKSSVSRGLAELERGLGVQLVHRSSRHVSLTEIGTVLYDRVRRILDELDEVTSTMEKLRGTPSGVLRINTSIGLGHAVLSLLLPTLLEAYADLDISVELAQQRISLLSDESDVVIRTGTLEDSSLIARKLGTLEVALYGSPAYLDRNGKPACIEDLAGHTIVDRPTTTPGSWIVHGPNQDVSVAAKPRLTVNDPALARLVVLRGGGLGWLPSFMCRDDIAAGDLIELLPGYRRDPIEVHALIQPHRIQSPKVRVFLDLAVRTFESPNFRA